MFDHLSQVTPMQWALVLGIVAIFLTISFISIWDAFHKEFNSVNEKVAWIQICIFIPVLGGIAYLLIGKRRGKKIK